MSLQDKIKLASVNEFLNTLNGDYNEYKQFCESHGLTVNSKHDFDTTKERRGF